MKKYGRESQELARKFGVRGIPMMVVTTPKGEEISRVVGFREPNDFIAALKKIIKDYRRYEEAAEEAKKNPDDATIQRKLGEACVELGKVEEAEKAFKKVLELDKENAKGEKARALLGLADIEMLQKKTASKDEMAKTVKKAKKYIDDWRALNDKTLESDAEYLSAIASLLSNAFEKDYTRSQFAKELKQCLETYCKRFKKGRYMPRALFTLARLQSASGEKEAMKKTLSRLAQDFPKTEEGRTAKRVLDRMKEREEKKSK